MFKGVNPPHKVMKHMCDLDYCTCVILTFLIDLKLPLLFDLYPDHCELKNEKIILFLIFSWKQKKWWFCLNSVDDIEKKHFARYSVG